jgi:hypothetical protein
LWKQTQLYVKLKCVFFKRTFLILRKYSQSGMELAL